MSVAEGESERVLDSAGGPVRRLRQKISKLNIRIRELSGSDVMCTATDDDDADDFIIVDSSSSSDDDDGDGKKICRRRPKNLSYKKKRYKPLLLIRWQTKNTSSGSLMSLRTRLIKCSTKL